MKIIFVMHKKYKNRRKLFCKINLFVLFNSFKSVKNGDKSVKESDPDQVIQSFKVTIKITFSLVTMI